MCVSNEPVFEDVEEQVEEQVEEIEEEDEQITSVCCLECDKEFDIDCDRSEFERGKYDNFCSEACNEKYQADQKARCCLGCNVKEPDMFVNTYGGVLCLDCVESDQKVALEYRARLKKEQGITH